MVANKSNANNVLSNLLAGAFVSTVPCALVLEDNPKPYDNSIRFESFPGEITEAYSVQGYDEIANRRMSQPGFAIYRGGNWNVFSITLNFRAGVRPGGGALAAQLAGGNIVAASIADLEGQLLLMERRVRWCQALTMPMKRDATAFQRRIVGKELADQVQSSGAFRTDPPMVFVVLGSFATWRCYVTNVNLTWKGPWHPISARPSGCEVQITFQRLDRDRPDWDTVRNSAGFFPTSPNIPTIQGLVLINRQ